MSRLIKATIFLSVLWSCNNQTNKENLTESNEKIEQISIDFEKYISTLMRIPLPLEHNTLGELPELSKDYDKNGFKSYNHTWTSQPLGIYYQDEKTVGIIDCAIGDYGLVPFLTTYDLKGNKIDSTGFYNKSGQDMGYFAIEHVTFKPNRTIVVIDTVKRWDFNEEETDIIEGSMEITTGKVEYRILENGRIERK